MAAKSDRIVAGIVIGCVLAIASAGGWERNTQQGITPKSAQGEECVTLMWGESQFLAGGWWSNWPDKNEIRQNYTVCAGFDHAINITWDAHTLQITYVNVSIGTTLLARNRSGTIFLLYNQLPANQENITLVNDNGTSIAEFEYSIALQNANPKPLITSNVPISGGGAVIAIAYVAVIVLGIASFKLPQKYRVLALLGNVIMPVVWFGGGAATNLSPPLAGFGIGGFPGFDPVCGIGCTTFTVPENSGLVISAYIDFQVNDPISMGFTYNLIQGTQANPVIVYSGSFYLSSAFAEPEQDSVFLPLPAGEYRLAYGVTPSSRMDVSFQIPSAFSDIAPGTDIGLWRWAFLIVGICAAIICLIAVIKGKQQGKVTKIIPKPVFANTPQVTLSTPPIAGPVTSWTCAGCGKPNEEAAKFCVGCGKSRNS